MAHKHLFSFQCLFISCFIIVGFMSISVRPENFVTINMCCELDIEFEPQAHCGDERTLESPVNVLTDASIKPNLTFPPFLTTTLKNTTYSVQAFRPNCTNGFIVRHFYIDSSPNGTNGFRMEPNGVLRIGPRPYDTFDFRVDQYCLNGIEQGHVQFLTCEPPCSLTEPCIQKCCPLDRVISLGQGKHWDCHLGQSEITPTDDYTGADKSKYVTMANEETLRTQSYYRIHNPSIWPQACSNGIFDIFTEDLLGGHEVHPMNGSKGFGKRTYFVMENGRVFYRMVGGDLHPVDYSCIDGFANTKDLKNPDDKVKKMIIFACTEPPLKNDSTILQKVKLYAHNFYGALSISCSVFSLATVIIYMMLWRKQNVYGWTFMSFCATIFGRFLFLGIAYLVSDGQNPVNSSNEAVRSNNCSLFVLICNFCFVASFSWLSMLSLELWLTFRAVVVAGPRLNGLARYVGFSLIGWGVPAALMILNLKHSVKNGSPAKTNFLMEFCLASTRNLWEFVYGPSLILLIATILCFLLTTKTFNEYKRRTQSASQEIPNSKSYAQFVKLLYIVIIVWIIQGITWTLQATNTSPTAWHLILSISCIEPLAIFYIYAMNQYILKDLADTLFSMNCPLSPSLWLLRWRRRSSGFPGPSFNYDDGDPLADENSPLSVSRTQYREVPRSDYIDADRV